MNKRIPGDFCLLCGGPSDVIGVFVPDDPQRWGAAPGKTRFVRYCLCEKCKSKNDTPIRVEKVILAELAGAGVIYE